MQQDSVIRPIYIEFKTVKTSVELKTQKPGEFGILQKELLDVLNCSSVWSCNSPRISFWKFIEDYT